MVLEDDRGVAEVVASLFKQENSPRVLVFSIPGNVAVNLLEFNGYHALLMSGHEAVELAQRTPSAVIMLDSAVLNLLLKEDQGGLESRAAVSAVSKQQGALLIEDERTAELMQQKIQLQEALARAEGLLQTLGEIARGSLRAVGHTAE
jgi:CheY-like chemotaxis protein